MDNDSKLENELLICEALGIDRTDLIKDPQLLNKENNKLKEFKSRQKNNEPLAYIVGYQPFMGLKFFVDKNVLIPRPETELLVEEALNLVTQKHSDNSCILDLCTGSGAIAVSLAKLLPKTKLTAVDISEKALHVAKNNSDYHKVADRITFVHGDLFEPLKGKKFDLIVSNPPYIPTKEIDKLESSVKDFEPRIALNGGPDGLDFIKKIIIDAKKHLNNNGILMFEIGFGQSKDVENALKINKYSDIRVKKDYNGVERIIYGIFKSQ